MFEHLFVALVILWVDPWFAVALSGELVHHALHVARREPVNPWALWHRFVFGPQRGRARVGVCLFHVVQQPAHIATCQV